MAARHFLRQRSVVPTLLAMSTGTTLISRPSLHAEAPPGGLDGSIDKNRKPIYDDPSSSVPADPSSSSSSSSSSPSPPKRKPSQSPSPTDRLAAQIGQTRVLLHSHAAGLEDRTNDALTNAFRLEKSFTSTIASLAPSPGSKERFMPGAIYVLVAAMGSSILVRNRNVLLRAGVPLAVGIAAGYAVIPETMQNVGDLVWSYEKRWPVLADTHIRVKDRVTGFVETGIAHSKMSAAMLEQKIGEARETLEGWVKKGK